MRVELFGDEIESMRWFSTFTQRSLGDAERVEIAPAAELDAEHRELAELAALEAARRATRRQTSPSCCRSTASARSLDLVARRRRGRARRRRGDRAGAADHWEDVDHGDARRRRRATSTSTSPSRSRERAGADAVTGARRLSDEPTPSAPRAPSSAARSVEEAETELEKLVRSGYRTVVAFDATRRGRARRATTSTASKPRSSTAAALSRRARLCLRRGAAARGLRLTRAEARGRSRTAASSTAAGAAEPRPAAARGRLAASPTCGSATTSSTRTTASPASPASRPRRSAGVTRDYLDARVPRRATASSSPPTSSRSSAATSAPAATPTLSALGGKRWENMKARARRAAARELAGELINLYAERQAAQRPRLRARRRVAAASSSAPSPTARPPTSSRRSRRSRATWSRSGRWTG